MYWTAWGAAIGFVYAKGGQFHDYPWIFLLLAFLTVPILIGTLKWNTEFANHMAAAASVCKALGLNIEHANNTKLPCSISNTLPYEEFQGYMGLPLRMPAFLNIAALLALMESTGFALAIGLFLYGLDKKKAIQILGKDFSVWHAVAAAGIALSISLVVCILVFFKMRREIRARRMKFGLPVKAENKDVHTSEAAID